MAEEPFERLAAQAKQAVPPPDQRFVDRLESDLRVAHARHATSDRAHTGAWRFGWGLALAGVLLVVGFLGLTQFAGDDPGVPVQVSGEGSEFAGADGPGGAEDGEPGESIDDDGQIAQDVPGTPTPTPNRADPQTDQDVTIVPGDDQPATPTPLVIPTPDPDVDSVPDTPPTSTPTPLPDRPVDVTATPPSQTPITPTASPTSVVRATPAPTIDPTPVPEPTATPTPRPTVRPAPVPLSLTCAARTSGDATGVVCEWRELIGADFDRYMLFRSKNGGETAMIATRRADAQRLVIDRDVSPGDTGTYLLRALLGDAVIGVSQRVNVRIPPT